MNNLIKNLEKMAERERTSFQKIVEIVSEAIEVTYKRINNDKNFNIEVDFDGDNFVVNDGHSKFEIKDWNFDKNFSYQCAGEIKRVIEEFRKEEDYKYFLPLKNEVISGSLQSINEVGKYCIVNLGNGLGHWDKRELKKENLARRISLGTFLRFIIVDVKKLENSTQVLISRNGSDFVKRVFELEIPEIADKLVNIEEVIRIDGVISKVIVRSENDRRIDPIGVCIGKDRIRIRSILRELGKERVDLVYWSENKKKMLINLLSPSEIISIIERSEIEWDVLIPNYRISLILQYSGKILQSIEKYLQINIKIRDFESAKETNETIIWNGNVNFSDYEMRKKINLKKISEEKS